MVFKITSDKGFHITFDNGVTVSVQFGYGNYCENKEHPDKFALKHAESCNAEVAVWDENDDWIIQKYDDDIADTVAGWITPNKLLDIMNWAANYKGD